MQLELIEGAAHIRHSRTMNTGIYQANLLQCMVGENGRPSATVVLNILQRNLEEGLRAAPGNLAIQRWQGRKRK